MQMVVPEYIEEEAIGTSGVPALIEPTNKKYCVVSGRCIILYEVETGKRINVLNHPSKVIGAHWTEGNLLSITANGEVLVWNLETGEILGNYSTSYKSLMWTYENDGVIFALGKNKTNDESMDMQDSNSEDSNTTPTSTSFCLFQLISEGDKQLTKQKPVFQQVLSITDPIAEKKCLAVTKGFAAICSQKEVKLLPLENSSLVSGPTSFSLRTKFDNVRDNSRIIFDCVHIQEDSLYVSLSIGRIYFWSRIRTCGLDHSNKSFINVCGSSFCFVVSSHRTIFTGDGECAIAKWNLNTSGAGRWYRAEYLNVEAPVERLLLSADASLLVAVLADNGTYVLKTATMTVVSRAQTLLASMASPFQWMGINIDPAQPDYVVTNARLGNIQWLDPTKWRTITLFDVSEENPPPRDYFDSPDYFWLNPYLICPTVTRIVTCEARRNDPHKTYIKFYKRMKLGSMNDIKLDDSIVSHRRIIAVRSNLDEVLNPTDEDMASEEYLRIDEHGYMDCFISDSNRTGKWIKDMTRAKVCWQNSSITHCSRIRRGNFATVNTINDQRFLIIWRLSQLIVSEYIDCLRGMKQVEWAPITVSTSDTASKSILLITTEFGVTSYNTHSRSFLWKIVLPSEFSLFSNNHICFIHDSKRVIRFGPIDGAVIDVQHFSLPQEKIVAIGRDENTRFIGISSRGGSKKGPMLKQLYFFGVDVIQKLSIT
ncbi:hypothetical protein DdX_01896 [Ditylenchus destructor]|uniref:Uncharacterized protein n=1 Tax=Ditylenchus destructor TaxID=166010 RepID=A0AAD4NGB1_9BILA|nr:hypothetical protein DdX_01896 [Ditylenchus destructor]